MIQLSNRITRETSEGERTGRRVTDRETRLQQKSSGEK